MCLNSGYYLLVIASIVLKQMQKFVVFAKLTA